MVCLLIQYQQKSDHLEEQVSKLDGERLKNVPVDAAQEIKDLKIKLVSSLNRCHFNIE